MIEIISCNTKETFELGRKIGSLLKGGEIILLSGDLGAGKTLIVKGIGSGLGINENTTVVSPTFTLVNFYEARIGLVHVDLYRLDFDGIRHLGLEDYMDNKHVIVVEWADISGGFFKGDILRIRIEYLTVNSRKIFLDGNIIKEEDWR